MKKDINAVLLIVLCIICSVGVIFVIAHDIGLTQKLAIVVSDYFDSIFPAKSNALTNTVNPVPVNKDEPSGIIIPEEENTYSGIEPRDESREQEVTTISEEGISPTVSFDNGQTIVSLNENGYLTDCFSFMEKTVYFINDYFDTETNTLSDEINYYLIYVSENDFSLKKLPVSNEKPIACSVICNGILLLCSGEESSSCYFLTENDCTKLFSSGKITSSTIQTVEDNTMVITFEEDSMSFYVFNNECRLLYSNSLQTEWGATPGDFFAVYDGIFYMSLKINDCDKLIKFNSAKIISEADLESIECIYMSFEDGFKINAVTSNDNTYSLTVFDKDLETVSLKQINLDRVYSAGPYIITKLFDEYLFYVNGKTKFRFSAPGQILVLYVDENAVIYQNDLKEIFMVKEKENQKRIFDFSSEENESIFIKRLNEKYTFVIKSDSKYVIETIE